MILLFYLRIFPNQLYQRARYNLFFHPDLIYDIVCSSLQIIHILWYALAKPQTFSLSASIKTLIFFDGKEKGCCCSLALVLTRTANTCFIVFLTYSFTFVDLYKPFTIWDKDSFFFHLDHVCQCRVMLWSVIIDNEQQSSNEL